MTIRHVGYPCIRVDGNRQTVKTCNLKNATDDRLKELIDRNLNSLREVLEFNVHNDIYFFRIHSDTIPFASHPDVDFDWLDYAADDLAEIGRYVEERDMRLSMHPGQYTVLNSEDEGVVENAVRNLRYHARFLDALEVGTDAKIVVHIGGVYGDRDSAMERFIETANSLAASIRNRLVIENDETSYHVKHVLSLSEATDLPVIFDQLHHRLHTPEGKRTAREWIAECFNTWNEADGVPIVHFSSESGGDHGHHADRIDSEAFREFRSETEDLPDCDVMLECKDKEVALLELRDALNGNTAGST